MKYILGKWRIATTYKGWLWWYVPGKHIYRKELWGLLHRRCYKQYIFTLGDLYINKSNEYRFLW